MRVPHPIPYQGSKRRLAPRVLQHLPRGRRLFEPFAGSAAVTLAAARANRAERFVVSDTLAPLAGLWSAILADGDAVARGYRARWHEQAPDPRAYYERIRDRFNGTADPIDLLYLLARCVKNAVRFNQDGAFNQAADHRRLGMHPDKMQAAVHGAASLLGGRAEVLAADYRAVLERATADDTVYLDPPYQGVGGRDRRYVEQLDLDAFVATLEALDARGVPYLVSFDGRLGDRIYGTPLPEHLGLLRIDVDAGRSSQATLHGRDARTVESLYVSRAAVRRR